MAFEDSHTLFVTKWLRAVGLEHLLDRWYSYRNGLFREKERHPKRAVYSRLYEFCDSIIESFREREKELCQAYDDTLQDFESEEKLEVEI
jgi:hypothetical protein